MKGIMFNEHFGLESAVLSGRKTQTRRIIKQADLIARHWNPELNPQHCYYKDERGMCQIIDEETRKVLKPQFNIGKVVAIKQSYKDAEINPLREIHFKVGRHTYKDFAKNMKGWSNKMYVKNDLMPHRIKITNIRVERLRDISEEDCLREGVSKILRFTDNEGNEVNEYTHKSIHGKHYYTSFDTPQQAFASLIDKVSGKGTWASNPYVWVYDFELTDKTE